MAQKEIRRLKVFKQDQAVKEAVDMMFKYSMHKYAEQYKTNLELMRKKT